jgi:threonine dehydrogenase-like Zn-dependent dehydrogenase
MQAVHLESGLLSLIEVPLPDRGRKEALIKVDRAGICSTDLELQRGYYGFAGTPGHEFVGTVVDSGTVSLVGKRVVGEINLACGECDWCHRGLGRHCPTRTVLGIVNHPGTFAEYVSLPERNLHIVPDEISTDEAVFVEPLAAACEILDQVEFPEGARVAVLGDGKLGLLIAQVLALHGLAVVQFGRHPKKLEISANAGVEVRSAERLPVKEFPYVVEATGSQAGLRQAVAMATPRGTVILKSTIHGEVPIDTAPVIVDEITMIGSRCGRFEPALARLEKKRVNVRSMISMEFPLSPARDAFAEAARPGVLKVLLRP